MRIESFIALRFLRHSRGQTLMIMVGIAVGVAVIVFVTAMIQGLQQNVIDRTLGTQAHVILQASELRNRPAAVRSWPVRWAGCWCRRSTIGGLAGRAAESPEALSGGQQQRVAIACALMTWPPLVLADEPTGNLDTRTAAEVFRLPRQVNSEQGCAVIIVTHDLRLARQCDRTVALIDGRLATPAELAEFDSPPCA